MPGDRLAKTQRFDSFYVRLEWPTFHKIQFIKFYIFIKFLPRYKRLPPESLYLGSVGDPGLDMVNELDPLGLREELRVGHNVMSHYSLIFFADVIEIFPKMY